MFRVFADIKVYILQLQSYTTLSTPFFVVLQSANCFFSQILVPSFLGFGDGDVFLSTFYMCETDLL